MFDRIIICRQSHSSNRLHVRTGMWKKLTSFFLLLVLVSCSSEYSSQKSHLVYPEPDSERALLYISKCGECHAAPLPTAHTANMWLRVVDRMQFRMVSKKIFPLNESDKASVLQYLQTYSKKNKI